MHAQDRLIILLHGLGASGTQLMPLAAAWRAHLPNCRFVAPDAPSANGRGRQWFGVDRNGLSLDNIELARRSFDDTVSEIVRNEGFDDAHHRVAFVGVSQGGIVALDAIASGRWQINAVVSYAGLLPLMQVSRRSIKTRVLLVHGKDDRTIPSVASGMAADQLRAAGFTVKLDLLPAVGHTISLSGAEKGLRFLQDSFGDGNCLY